MRKWLFLAASVSVLWTELTAQNELDALRYSNVTGMGSARTMGMAGAFSSIGADPSAVMINPAGIATFRRSEFSIGFQFLNTANNATYIDYDLKETRLNFNMPNLHLVATSIKYDDKGKPKKKGLASTAFGFNINRLANFNGRIAYDAENKSSSVTDFLADRATAQNEGLALSYGSLGSLAFESGAIEYDNAAQKYVSAYKDSNRNNIQTGEVSSRGGIYEYQVTGGLNFSNKVMVGLGLFYSTLRYVEDFSILETDRRPVGTKPDLATVDYQAKINDRGNAFGARFGIIARPTEQLRLAASIHTPRTFTINSEYGYSVAVTGDQGAPTAPPAQFNDPLNTYKYKVTTPARYNLGVGFVLQKSMLLNADIETVDYASARMAADDVVSFGAENAQIRRNYRNVTNVRIGAEFNFANPDDKEQAYRFRLGFGFLPSPYSDRLTGRDEFLGKSRTILATGFGFRDKDFYMDFSLSAMTDNNYYIPYLTTTPIFPSYSISNKQRRILFGFTMGWNLD